MRWPQIWRHRIHPVRGASLSEHSGMNGCAFTHTMHFLSCRNSQPHPLHKMARLCPSAQPPSPCHSRCIADLWRCGHMGEQQP